MTFNHTQLNIIKGTKTGGDSVWKVPGFTLGSIKSTVKALVAELERKGFDVDVNVATTGSTYLEAYKAEGDRVCNIRVSDHFKRDEYTLRNTRDVLNSIVQVKEFSDGVVQDEFDLFEATIVSQEGKEEVLNAIKDWA
jgi:hypothetical protein